MQRLYVNAGPVKAGIEMKGGYFLNKPLNIYKLLEVIRSDGTTGKTLGYLVWT